MRLRQATKRRARIEIIPLIDIIFFLLATFVMVSFSMIKNQGISVKLPKAATGVAQERDKEASATVTVKENGTFYLNKEKIEEADLLARLKALRAANPEQKVFVNGDELSYFGDVVAVLDGIRVAGIDKISIQTQGAKAEAPGAINSKESAKK